MYLSKILAFAGVLGLIVLLDPIPTTAQPPSGGGKGFGGGKGGGFDRGNGGFGNQGGGFGNQGGGGFPAPGQPNVMVIQGGGQPGTTYSFQPAPGGGGFGQPPGGGGFGNQGGGGRRDFGGGGGGFGQGPGGGGDFGRGPGGGGGFGQGPGGGGGFGRGPGGGGDFGQGPGGGGGFGRGPGGGGDFGRGPGGGGDFGRGPGGGGDFGRGPGGGGDFGRGPGGGGGGPGRGQMDPDQIWTMLVRVSGGTDTVRFDNIPPETKAMMRRMSEQMGTKPLPETGEWNRTQFMDYYAANASIMQQRGGGGGGGGGDPAEMAMSRIRQQDRDGDGRISRAEADDRLKPNFDAIDTNGDGYITAEEYIAYMRNRMGGGGGGGGPNGSGDYGRDGRDGRDGRQREEPLVAIRYGKLPPGTDPMFVNLDTDKDAQIALYEWRAAGESIEKFNAMDLNGDGLITVEEFARYKQLEADKKLQAAKEEGLDTPSGRPNGGGGRPTFNGNGGGNNYGGNGSGNNYGGNGANSYGKPNGGGNSDARIIPGNGPPENGKNPFRDSGGPPQGKGKNKN